MLTIKYKEFKKRQDLCDFLNNDQYIQIVQIVETIEKGITKIILYYKKEDI